MTSPVYVSLPFCCCFKKGGRFEEYVKREVKIGVWLRQSYFFVVSLISFYVCFLVSFTNEFCLLKVSYSRDPEKHYKKFEVVITENSTALEHLCLFVGMGKLIRTGLHSSVFIFCVVPWVWYSSSCERVSVCQSSRSRLLLDVSRLASLRNWTGDTPWLVYLGLAWETVHAAEMWFSSSLYPLWHFDISQSTKRAGLLISLPQWPAGFGSRVQKYKKIISSCHDRELLLDN